MFVVSQRALCLLSIMFAVSWFGTLELRGLFNPDEGRYAEIPREMTVTGDWITPRLNDLKYFEKPPLQYWLTAASFVAFGDDEWSARLPSALLGFLSVLMTAFTAQRLWGRDGAISTGVVLGSSWGFFLTGQYLTLDMTLSAFLTMGLSAFLLAQRPDASQKCRRRWMWVAWTACALATLSKGLIGVVLPALALLTYSVVARDIRVWQRLEILRGSLLLVALTLPWFALVQHRNPEFFQFFFVQEHFQRFTTPQHSRPGAWWYYMPILLIGAMPWLPGVLSNVVDRSSRAETTASSTRVFRPDLFCAAWMLAIVLFFSASHSKLPAYVIPVFPALALLVGRRSFLGNPRALRWCALGLVSMGGALTLGATQLGRWQKFVVLGPDALTGTPWLYAATSMLIVTGLSALWFIRRSVLANGVLAIVVGSFSFWGLSFAFLHHVDDAFSAERLIEPIVGKDRPFAPSATFYSIGQLDYSALFYLGRPVILVDYHGELEPGLRAESQKSIATIGEFQQRWAASPESAYALMNRDRYRELQLSGLPMYLIAENRRLVVVGRTNQLATQK